MRYLVIIEQGPTSYGAYVPDLPGCVTVGNTREDVVAGIREAIELHLEGMIEDGDPIPLPTSAAIEVEVNVAVQAVAPAPGNAA